MKGQLTTEFISVHVAAKHKNKIHFNKKNSLKGKFPGLKEVTDLLSLQKLLVDLMNQCEMTNRSQ